MDFEALITCCSSQNNLIDENKKDSFKWDRLFKIGQFAKAVDMKAYSEAFKIEGCPARLVTCPDAEQSGVRGSLKQVHLFYIDPEMA